MTENTQYIKKQIRKEIDHLQDLYHRIDSLERKGEQEEEKREYRAKRLESQLLKENPGMKIDPELLALVGIHPYNPPSKDKEVIRRAIAEHYGAQ